MIVQKELSDSHIVEKDLNALLKTVKHLPPISETNMRILCDKFDINYNVLTFLITSNKGQISCKESKLGGAND